MGLEYFPCYHSYRKKCEKLTDQELGRLFRALMSFSETGERQELAGRESIAFDFIADDIARAKKAYDEKCRTNKANRGKRTSTDGYDRQRPSTTVNDRQRMGTTVGKDKDKTKDEDKTKGVVNPPTPLLDDNNADFGAVMSAYMDRVCATPSQMAVTGLEHYTKSVGKDVVLWAIDAALDANKANWNYIRAILADKEQRGVKNLDDLRAIEANRERRGASGTGKYDFLGGSS